jgi:hypothetical protein
MKNMEEPGTTSRLQTSLLLSMIVHVGFLALAGSWARHVLVDGGRFPSAGSVMMLEWVDSPAPSPVVPPATSPEESSSVPKESPSIKGVATSDVPSPTAGSLKSDHGGNAAPGKRLEMDAARSAWVQQVIAKTLRYQRNAPRGFEDMVRAALAANPVEAGGTAKVSFRTDPSGSVGIVILSDSPELKSALDRVGWDAAPLPSRYQIPFSGVDVTISIAGERLSVGIEIL